LSLAGMRLAIPLIFAAYGGLFSEKSGVANIALEAYLLAGAFGAAATTAYTHSIVLGLLAGILATLLVACLFAFVCVEAKADQIVAGTAINMLVAGILPVFSRAVFGVSGATPSLSADLRFESWSSYALIALGVFVLVSVCFQSTVFGLRITAAGENPSALTTQGVKVKAIRWRAILVGAAIASLGGVYISMVQGSGFTRNMSAGRGYIALAALILGRWKPWPTLLACIFFGYADSAQMLMQGVSVGGEPIPNQFIQILPYLVTLILLAGVGAKVQPPRAINTRD
jgi:general nucleoside transport system permease protein